MQLPQMRVNREEISEMGQGWWEAARHLPTLYVMFNVNRGREA